MLACHILYNFVRQTSKKMMKMNKKYTLLTLVVCLLTVFQASAFDKKSYYSSANGKKGQALKTALCSIIGNHNSISYDGLWTCFESTDKRDDGKVWDMYSNITNYDFKNDRAGSYSKEGDVYNREHSFPKSWFNDGKPMYSDLYHLYPTDGYINGLRSNYCFGEVGTTDKISSGGFSKRGTPTSDLKSKGCNESIVFEPNDQYKGDFARSYFYMLTRYESQISSWSSGMLAGNKYPGFSSWATEMLMAWSKKDLVSEKETDRIEAVYSFQNNRNPFIDYPGLEEYIWGEWQDVAFSTDNYINPYENENPGGGDNPGGGGDNPGGGGDNPGDNPGDVTPGELIWHETFNANTSTGGNDSKWSGISTTPDPECDLAGWSYEVCYGAYKCVRLGTGSKKGSATTPAFGHAGDFVLTFMAGAWGSDNTTLSITVNNGGTADAESVEMENGKFNTYQVIITDATANTTVTLAGQGKNSRFFLDEVKLNAYEESDGVEEVHLAERSPILDLAGRRVSTITRPGIYIVGGRKIAIGR